MSDFWHHYVELLSDPAHTATELTFTFVVDIFVLGMLWPLVRRFIDNRLRHEHEALDREHGVSHDVAGTSVAPSSAACAPADGESLV